MWQNFRFFLYFCFWVNGLAIGVAMVKGETFPLVVSVLSLIPLPVIAWDVRE